MYCCIEFSRMPPWGEKMLQVMFPCLICSHTHIHIYIYSSNVPSSHLPSLFWNGILQCIDIILPDTYWSVRDQGQFPWFSAVEVGGWEQFLELSIKTSGFGNGLYPGGLGETNRDVENSVFLKESDLCSSWVFRIYPRDRMGRSWLRHTDFLRPWVLQHFMRAAAASAGKMLSDESLWYAFDTFLYRIQHPTEVMSCCSLWTSWATARHPLWGNDQHPKASRNGCYWDVGWTVWQMPVMLIAVWGQLLVALTLNGYYVGVMQMGRYMNGWQRRSIKIVWIVRMQ